MDYTDEQKQDFIDDFSRRRIRQLALTIPIGIAIVAFFIFEERITESALAPIAFAAVVVAVLAMIAFSLYNWRCPACNKYLGKGINPRFCQKCGAQLRP